MVSCDYERTRPIRSAQLHDGEYERGKTDDSQPRCGMSDTHRATEGPPLSSVPAFIEVEQHAAQVTRAPLAPNVDGNSVRHGLRSATYKFDGDGLRVQQICA